MQLSHLFESTAKNVLVIFPGRFQPVTKNHAQVYAFLCKKYGPKNVFIASSNKVDPPRSPFSFNEKKALLQFIGIDPSHIIETKSPYSASEITQNYDPNNTVLIFAVGQKDMEEDPRFSFKPKKDGSPSYFQPMNNKVPPESFAKHAYIVPIPTLEFSIAGQKVKGATQIREMFANATPDEQKKLFTDLYGKFNPTLFDIVSKKLSNQVEEGLKDNIKRVAAGGILGLAAFAGSHHHDDQRFNDHTYLQYVQNEKRKQHQKSVKNISNNARRAHPKKNSKMEMAEWKQILQNNFNILMNELKGTVDPTLLNKEYVWESLYDAIKYKRPLIEVVNNIRRKTKKAK